MAGTQDRTWLLYGAYGYTGRLIARSALARGLTPVLAGRDRRKTEALARQLGLEARVFELDDGPSVAERLDGVAAFVHAAGPFLVTWRSVAEACLARGVHYLDITGEVDVFEALAAMDGRAREAGVALLPGAGFDVVPTDCAAVRAASALDEPVRLEIAFAGSGGPSRGSMRTVLTSLDQPARERVDGRLVPRAPGSATRDIPYSDRRRLGVLGSWGDLATAWRSTGVPNIRTYLPIRPEQLRWLRAMRPWMRLPGSAWLARAWVDVAFKGPDGDELADGWCGAKRPTPRVAPRWPS